MTDTRTDLFRPLTRRERWRLLPPVHEAWYALHWLGLRARLRCPECKAVGTWKPHGTIEARLRHEDIKVRRWLCKWCGYYNGPRGSTRCYPDQESGVWALPDTGSGLGRTPAEVIREHLSKTWPWRG